jgi:two-component system chemotaxis response regulator CheY
MRALIVDDSQFIRLSISNYLQNNNIIVVGQASNGNEAIELYKELRPDVVTMDITMPDMDGVETVKRIIDIHPKAKIIICSAVNQQPLLIEAIKAGAKSYLIKPLSEERVILEINKVLCDKH